MLYFYPKDNTPGCTTQGADFRDHHKEFKRLGCEIYGISRDSLKSHESFKAKLKFPFELLSDADEALCSAFGVMKDKNMYGRKVRGIERSTFVIDEKGRLAREWGPRGCAIALTGPWPPYRFGGVPLEPASPGGG